ncbi:MAG: hypothetical protein KAR39_12320 [Thermoplasmata archaeon]|nr:hypothetical protein [Thermoplasmata archaeon]
MKWGIRRKRGSGGRVSKDHTESRKLLKKPKMTLSNEDIKRVNKRLNLERDMTRMDPTKRGAGKRAVSKFLGQYGSVVISAAAGAAGAATVSAVKKATSHAEVPGDDDISHYGVKGMRWGVRRKRGAGGGVGDHKSRVKGLKSEIKGKKRARIGKHFDKMATDEVAAYKKLDVALGKELSAISASDRNKVSKHIKKMFVRDVYARKRLNVVGKIEGDYIQKERKRSKASKKAKRAAEHKLDTELSTLFADGSRAATKGKGPVAAIKAYRAFEKSFDAQATERWLALDLEYA